MKKGLLMLLGLAALSACSLNEPQGTAAFPAGKTGSVETQGYGEGTMVKLYYAKSEATTGYKAVIRGYVAIKNVAYDKQVVAHYNVIGESQWLDAHAWYLGTDTDGYEIWEFVTEERSANPRVGFDVQFAIKYVVNGQEYWDNNDGQDYKVGYGPRKFSPDVVFGKSMVALYNARASIYNETMGSGSFFYGDVYVNDTNKSGVMKLVYTLDNWNTVQVYTCDPNLYSNYFWYYIPIPNTVTSIKFAFAYEWNGVTIWDNNFGRNYEVFPVVY